MTKMQKQLEELKALNADYLRQINDLVTNGETYRVLLDESSDPIFMFDQEGTYVYVNRAFAEGVNRKLDEIIHKRIWDVFQKDEADKRFAVVRWVFENRETRIIEVRVPRTDGDRYYITTVKPVLNADGNVTSVICISKEITERKRMEEELRHANEQLAAHLAEIESLHETLREQAIRDPLTGLYNLRFLAESMKREIAQALRDDVPLSVVLMDIDHFKKFNDTYGHKTGDEVLQALGKILSSHTRAGDIACRYGGEEFMIIMPSAHAAEAYKRAEQWREEFMSAQIIHKGQALSATLSAGVATFPDHGATDDEIWRAADNALYKAKSAGRNCVILYETGHLPENDHAN
jgi:diguanylate cyclase (GGDEF)-like protein/PAS domain S-box-containing protein